MVPARLHKFEHVTVTLLPTKSESSFRHIPSTFSPANRVYEWRQAGDLGYMIVPVKITNDEIQVDIFIDRHAQAKSAPPDKGKSIEEFVKGKMLSKWEGLRLGGISRVSQATPPTKKIIRGTIEEIIGTILDK